MLLNFAPGLPPSDGSSAFGNGFWPGYGTALTFRSLADQYSQPSDIWSTSVSARQGSVPIASSRLFASRSPSWSAELSHATVPPPPPPSPSPTPVTTGDRRRGVYLLNFPLRTRSFSRVGRWRLSTTRRRRATAAGTRSTSFVRVARTGFANAVRPSAPRKITVLRLRCALKFLPRIVSRLPTLTRIGVTRVMLGSGEAADEAAGATTSTADTAS